MRIAILSWLLLLAGLSLPVAAAADADELMTFSARDARIDEVMEMLSKSRRVSIMLSPEVGGEVSFSLFEVTLDEAIRTIANAAGFVVEQRNGTYFVMPRQAAGQFGDSDLTEIAVFDIQYRDAVSVQSLLQPYLSNFGKMTALPSGQQLLVEEAPAFMARIRAIMAAVDRPPRQILIEARILEVTLTSEDAFGIDWSRFFSSGDGDGLVGTRGFADAGGSANAGLVLDIEQSDLLGRLTALEQDGRIQTLSTPKLMVLEHEEASVIVGDRRGFQVTTTINQVTTESIEFLESGVILRVTPTVDARGRIAMRIHPEVSTGSVDASGIPSQTTTEVTTRLLIESGQTAFVGGLIKQSVNNSRSGVPVIARVPLLGRLFSKRESSSVNTETIVLIRPQIVDQALDAVSLPARNRVDGAISGLDGNTRRIEDEIDASFATQSQREP